MQLHIDTLNTPIGTMLLVADDHSLYALDFGDCEARLMAILRNRYADLILKRVINPCGFSTLVHDYFAGNLHAFDNVSTSAGGTMFQQKIWAALRTIPAATTVSYSQLAATLGIPKSSRAVGMANARNPIALVVPCHRVIGANGTLTGYAGGIERKEWLLAHEAAYANAITAMAS